MVKKGAMRRVCNNCSKETDQIYCPRCKVFTAVKDDRKKAPSRSKRGDTFECTIWQGSNFARGINIGIENRDRHFSKSAGIVVLHVEETRCLVKLAEAFWKGAPVIKIAKDDAGKNYLFAWIQAHDLQTPEFSLKEKGKVDKVLIEVIEPENEFVVGLPKGK